MLSDMSLPKFYPVTNVPSHDVTWIWCQ